MVMDVTARPAARLLYTFAVTMGMSLVMDMDMQLVINMYRKVEIHSAAIECQKCIVLNGKIFRKPFQRIFIIDLISFILSLFPWVSLQVRQF